jgi:hypothetical protein
MPNVVRGPLPMRVQVEGGLVEGETWVRIRFTTAQGENEFWLQRAAAQAVAGALLQAATGIVLP